MTKSSSTCHLTRLTFKPLLYRCIGCSYSFKIYTLILFVHPEKTRFKKMSPLVKKLIICDVEKDSNQSPLEVPVLSTLKFIHFQNSLFCFQQCRSWFWFRSAFSVLDFLGELMLGVIAGDERGASALFSQGGFRSRAHSKSARRRCTLADKTQPVDCQRECREREREFVIYYPVCMRP